MQLLAVACLSIAAKMDEIRVPQSVDLQVYSRILQSCFKYDFLCVLPSNFHINIDNEQVGEPKFVFEAKTIQKMELLVLSKLRWKMCALTPYSFIEYFLSKLTCEKHPTKSSIAISVQLILRIISGILITLWIFGPSLLCFRWDVASLKSAFRETIVGIDFLEFRPSEIAAAVAISVLGESQAKDIDKSIAELFIVEKVRLLFPNRACRDEFTFILLNWWWCLNLSERFWLVLCNFLSFCRIEF